MKLIYLTTTYGKRRVIRPGYTSPAFFFAGQEPADNVLITLDLPGLEQGTQEAITNWLIAYNPEGESLLIKALTFLTGKQETATRRDVLELPPKVWRLTVLDDFIEATNYRQAIWQASRLFPLKEYEAFGKKWLPQAQTAVANALAITNPTAKAAALNQLHAFWERIFGVMGQGPQKVYQEWDDLIYKLDKEIIASLTAKPFDFDTWRATVVGLQSNRGLADGLLAIGRHLAEQEPDTLFASLQNLGENIKIRQASQYYTVFWNLFQHKLRLPATVSDETIDISNAQAQRVQLNWQVINGRRIGRITPGKMALVLNQGGTIYYIAGDRKLKFQIIRAGGSLKRHGCILTMGGTVNNSLNKALLEAEQVDTLANVSPAVAIERVAHLNLPANHPVYAAAEAAGHNPKQARILADLLIELTVGIDADVARRLVRAQMASTRKQRR